MIMVTYPPAARSAGLVAPRAIGRMGAAIAEARAASQRREPAPAGRASPPAQVHVLPPPPERRTVLRLWLPSTLIFLILAPFALLLAPLLYFIPSRYAARPFATVFGVGQVLLSLGGTVVDVETPDALVRIRLF